LDIAEERKIWRLKIWRIKRMESTKGSIRSIEVLIYV
jgi:hypothetical protein